MPHQRFDGMSAVSYSSSFYRAVSVPVGEPVVLNEMMRLHDFGKPDGRTELRLSRDGENLYLKIDCFEPDPADVITTGSGAGESLWQGDLVEIFFGSVEPVAWQLQLAVGAGGGRYDSSGRLDLWKSETSLRDFGWSTEVKIPFSMLRFNNLATGFNVCRQSRLRQETTTWSGVSVSFHEAENYGELLFTDYNTAFFARTGVTKNKVLERAYYEKEMNARLVPAEKLLYGPYLSNPDTDRVTVSWITAGMCAAMLEYRKAGAQTGEWHKLPLCSELGVSFSSSQNHVAQLEGLEEDTEYEYRLINWTSVKVRRRDPNTVSAIFSFRTFSSQGGEFSFAVCSDNHSNPGRLRKLMQLPEVAETEFFVNLGDMLSRMSGPQAVFDGFLDVQASLYAHSRPLVFVRGNHEQIGLFSADYFQFMGHPSGRSWYVFRHGEVCFLVLDAGNDHPDDETGHFHNRAMLARERKWLEQTVRSSVFADARFRIAFMHMPPYNDSYGSEAALSLVKGLFDQSKLHLLISGHVHNYFRMEPSSGDFVTSRPSAKLRNAPIVPFTVIANDTDTITHVKCGDERLKVKVVAVDGTVVDQFSIEA